jgi:hypothetical protein
MRPLPRPLRWVAISFNLLQLLTTAFLLYQRGLRIEEVPMVRSSWSRQPSISQCFSITTVAGGEDALL